MKTHRTKEWFDNDDFWRDSYEYLFSESRFTEAAESMRKALQLSNSKGKSVLDLCCGPGRCSIALAARGLSVTGVDRTKFLLDKARVKARAARRKIEWVQADMRDFVRPGGYDLALSMFTSFGYFEKREDDAKVLANVYQSLRPGGTFIMEMVGKENLARIFQPSSAESLADGSILIERRRVVADWNRIENEWIVVRNGRASTFTFHLNLYSGQELRESLERAGFSNVKLYGSLNGTAYDQAAARLIAIAQK
jgi:SAM-dependent methyltransferase